MTALFLLAIDTATEDCSVALAAGDAVFEATERVGQRHSERVLPMIDALLASRGVAKGSLRAVAFGAGPGSFTGLRIACGVAQGIGYALGLPLVPVGNLAATALRAHEMAPAARTVAVAIDARMNEVYWGVYRIAGTRDGARAEELRAPALSPPEALPALLAGAQIDAVAGDALALFAEKLAAVTAPVRLPAARASAGAIARLAGPLWAAGRAVPPERAAPVYVRDRVALTIDERRAAAERAP